MHDSIIIPTAIIIIIIIVVFSSFLLSMEQCAAARKALDSVAVPPAPVRVPSQRPFAPSFASVTSVANGKGNNLVITCLFLSFVTVLIK